jgi:4-hydroxybenzoate polyprenyltransferase
VCAALTAYAHDRIWKEEVYLGIVVGSLVFSILYLIAYAAVEDLELQTTNKAFVRFK